MKAILILLTLASAGLGGWAWWEHSQRTHLEGELAASLIERDKLAKKARLGTGMKSGVVINEDGPTGLSEKAKELGLDIEEKEEEAKPKLKKTPGEKSKEPAAPDIAKMLRDPAMRDTLRAQSEAFLDFEYRDLFEHMGLDDKKRDAVMAILKDRAARQTDLGLKATDAKATDAERSAASRDYTKFSVEAGAQLKELLGDGYSQFERFENSQPEREHLRTLTSLLKDKNLTLDEATESKLMDAMYDTRREFKFERDLTNTTSMLPTDLSTETIDHFLQQNEELQRQVQSKAKAILSEEQFAVFLKSQESQQQMTQLNIQMLRQMTGGGKGVDGRN